MFYLKGDSMLFQDIVEHLGKMSIIFSAHEKERITIHQGGYNSAVLTFYKGGNQLSRLEVLTADRTIATQTYGERDSWALYKQETKSLILFSHAGRTDIPLS